MISNSSPSRTYRPNVMGTRHVVAAGHYMAAQSGLQILEAGGNAIDAGVATGLATAVLEPIYVSIAGVAPIIIYLAETREILTISGLGTWPRAATCEYFVEKHGGKIPEGIERTVMPAAPDAWITALERYGTMSFADVASYAIRFAREGFPVYPRMEEFIRKKEEAYRGWPSSAAIYLPGGRIPQVGDLFVQSDAAAMLEYMVHEEAKKRRYGRKTGLRAARDAFYRGDIATTIARYYADNGGLLTAEDLGNFSVAIEPPVTTSFNGTDVYGCGPWCQGPMLLQTLNLLEDINLADLGHNSPRYLHVLTEAIKLAAGDREAYYGDPRFVDVPMDVLLSKKYAKERRKLIREGAAWPSMPAAGDVTATKVPWRGGEMLGSGEGHEQSALDTSYLCVVDRTGNVFSATPSDGSSTAPVVPGTGSVISPRGVSSWADPAHTSRIAPGKRPRLTPNPAIAIRDNSLFMPFGSPGGDVQVPAMLQVFLNIFVFGMSPQAAIEAPRFASYSFPSSFEPHEIDPGRLDLEPAIGADVGKELEGYGHKVQWWPYPNHLAGSVCAVVNDTTTGVMTAAADFRRTSYAVGW